MSALDIAARGLARRALDTTDALPGADGATLMGHRRSEAAAILEPVSDILRRLDMAPASFGALHNPAISDYAALSAFTAALQASSQGIRRLEAKAHAFGHANASEMVLWDFDNGGLIGAGIDRTIIRNVHASANYAMGFGNCQNALFSDITFDGRVGKFNATGAIRNVIFNRCKFTTSPTQVINAVHFVCDTMSEGAQFIFFIDCEFSNPGRMGCEIQNNGAGATVRYANIHFIRPRFIGAGTANASVGQGLSLTGYGDTVTLDQPWFDGNRLVHLENVGCSRLMVRDMMVRQATHPTGKSCVSFSNTRPMHDCAFDGFQLVGEPGQDIAERPALDTAIFNIQANAKRLRLSRIKAAINNPTVVTGVIEANGATNEDITIEHCDLATNSNKNIVGLVNTTGNHKVRNCHLTSTHAARTAPLVAAWGSATVHVGQNRISYASGTQASLFAKSGTGALNVTHDNSGITTRYSAVHTIAAGQTASPVASHGLPGLPARFHCWPRGNTGGAVWATNHTSNTQIRANIPATLAAAVDVEVEAEYAW